MPHDATARAKQIAAEFARAQPPPPPARAAADAAAGADRGAADGGFARGRCRAPTAASFALDGKLAARERGRKLQYGARDVDLGALEQLVDESQTRAIGGFAHRRKRRRPPARRFHLQR